MMRVALLAIERLSAAGSRWLALLLGLAISGVVGLGVLVQLRSPQTSPAQRGQALAAKLGCFGCHGPEGMGGVPNPGAAEGEIPPLRAVATLPSYVQSEAELLEWVRDGKPQRLAKAPTGHRPLIEMPAYGEQLSSSELSDLVAYLKVLGGYERPADPELARGRSLAQGLGCFGCHGEDGRGQLLNPGSFKGIIPPWDSADFEHLVKDDEELRTWILDGTIPRLRDHPAAAFFLQRQAVKMPAYRGLLSDRELSSLVRYIRWVRRPAGFAGWQERWVQPRQPLVARGVVQRGRELYVSTGCAACHGRDAEGGMPNGAGDVPALDDLADKLELFEASDLRAFVKALEQGQRWDDPTVALPITEWPRVREQLAKMRELIVYGAAVAGEVPPPMPMPAWAYRVHPGAGSTVELSQVDAILAYLVSLSFSRSPP